MNLGLIGAIGGLGAGSAQVGKKYMDDDSQKERDERLYKQQGDLEAKRQAFQERLQANSQQFTREENVAIREHAKALQKEGFSHSEALAKAQREHAERLHNSSQAGADRRAKMEVDARREDRGTNVTDTDGNVFRVTGSTAAPVTVEQPTHGGETRGARATSQLNVGVKRTPVGIKDQADAIADLINTGQYTREQAEEQVYGRSAPPGSGAGTAAVLKNATAPATSGTTTPDSPAPARVKMTAPPARADAADRNLKRKIEAAEGGDQEAVEFLKGVNLGSVDRGMRSRIKAAIGE